MTENEVLELGINAISAALNRVGELKRANSISPQQALAMQRQLGRELAAMLERQTSLDLTGNDSVSTLTPDEIEALKEALRKLNETTVAADAVQNIMLQVFAVINRGAAAASAEATAAAASHTWARSKGSEAPAATPAEPDWTRTALAMAAAMLGLAAAAVAAAASRER